MGAESLLLIFLCVVYGYHATVLLFGTSHCLAIIFGEQQQQQQQQGEGSRYQQRFACKSAATSAVATHARTPLLLHYAAGVTTEDLRSDWQLRHVQHIMPYVACDQATGASATPCCCCCCLLQTSPPRTCSQTGSCAATHPAAPAPAAPRSFWQPGSEFAAVLCCCANSTAGGHCQLKTGQLQEFQQ
jgi:hypothetical protein